MTSDAAGLDVDVEAAAGAGVMTGIPNGEILIQFAEAVVRGNGDIAGLRAAVIEAVGADGAGQAVATITAFSGLVRVADGTGIPIDDGLAAVSVEERERLKLERLGGAANSQLVDVAARDFKSIEDLFENR